MGQGRRRENAAFVCAHCGREVLPLSNGSFRNHCPFCLYSLHVDEAIGDRLSGCHGLMEPVAVKYNSKKGYQIRHRCTRCGHEQWNRIAEDTVQPDDMERICALMREGPA